MGAYEELPWRQRDVRDIKAAGVSTLEGIAGAECPRRADSARRLSDRAVKRGVHQLADHSRRRRENRYVQNHGFDVAVGYCPILPLGVRV